MLLQATRFSNAYQYLNQNPRKGYWQLDWKQRFLLKNGITWF